MATRASLARLRRLAWPTSSSSTWSRKPRADRSPYQTRSSAPSAAPSATTVSATMNAPQPQLVSAAVYAPEAPSFLARLFDNRHFLGLLFMLPAAGLLIVFLTYPLGLGVFLGFTDAKVGRPGEWIGIENYDFLVTDSVFRLAVWNTFLYTFIASAAKFVLGLWLALLLNEH